MQVPHPPARQEPPQRPRRNLWLVGGSVVAVLIVAMAGTLLFAQRFVDSAGAEQDPVVPAEESEEDGTAATTEPEETTEEPMVATTLDESLCDDYDPSVMEDAFDSAWDSDSTFIDASEEGLVCNFYDDADNRASVGVSVYADAAAAVEMLESWRTIWGAEPDCTVSDYTDYGDVGFTTRWDDPVTVTIGITIAIDNVEIEAATDIDVNEHDEEAAMSMLQDLLEQADALLADY